MVLPQGDSFVLLLSHYLKLFLYIAALNIENDLQATWNAIVNDGVAKDPATRLLRLDGNVQWVGKISELYNRQCYDDLIVSMVNKTTVLIKGTPGIGKSLFLMVLLVWIVEKARAANEAIPSINYVRLEDQLCVYRLLSDGRVRIYDLATHGLPDYLLSDGCDLNVAYGKLLSLEVASDDKANYKNFEKRVQEASARKESLLKYMPLFSYEELLSIKGEMSLEEAAFRHEVFGGSARNFADRKEVDIDSLVVVNDTMLWMFGETKKTAHPDWWKTIVDKISAKLRQNDRELDKNTINSLMRHRTGRDVPIWATKFMEILSGVILDEKVLAIHTALENLIGPSGMGVAFESVGHKKISTCTAKYPLQSLHKPHQRKTKWPKEMSMRFNYPIQLIRTVEDLSHLPENTYALPIHGYFTLADFIVKTRKVTVIGNFTIADSHGGTLEQLNNILQQLNPKTNHRVIMLWVVKRENLDAFKWVSGLESIDQYVMTYEPVATLKRKRS